MIWVWGLGVILVRGSMVLVLGVEIGWLIILGYLDWRYYLRI